MSWIDISDEKANSNVLTCFTNTFPDNVGPFLGSGVEIIAKPRVIEDGFIIRNQKMRFIKVFLFFTNFNLSDYNLTFIYKWFKL